MSFRRRVVLLSAGAVASAIVLASLIVYLLTAHQLQSQLDASLRAKLTPGKQFAQRRLRHQRNRMRMQKLAHLR